MIACTYDGPTTKFLLLKYLSCMQKVCLICLSQVLIACLVCELQQTKQSCEFSVQIDWGALPTYFTAHSVFTSGKEKV